ncbi:hypothetical protein FAI41_03620 [Acetobacteraceae bacterium]|nr:hypothetical protein FAI41_03620 [Acetobacteraceae bacterium]
MSNPSTKGVVRAVEQQSGLSDQERTEAIEKIYGQEGVELGEEGEKTFAERAQFDKENPNASMISKMVGEENAEHELARSTPDTKADNI